MEISAQLVKTLRDKTGSGMMDCKRALTETNGDIEAAIDILRKNGLMDAAKKSSRVASDGLVSFSISDDGKEAVLVEINSETDFVARNAKFQNFVSTVSKVALEVPDMEKIMSTKYPSSEQTIRDELDLLISLVGENITLKRIEKLSVKNGMISTYIHSAATSNMGKIGVLVGFEASDCCSSGKCDVKMKEAVSSFGRKIAMHIAAANATFLSTDCVPADVIAREKSIAIAQAKENGKNDEVAEAIATGKISKFFDEYVLLEQIFVMENKMKIKDVLARFNKENNCHLEISGFKKFVLGEMC